MKVFVYEHMTAGQFLLAPADASPADRAAMQLEGQAMLLAVCADFAAAGHQVEVMLESVQALPAGCQPHLATRKESLGLFDRLAAAADYSLIIAPECDGVLSSIVRRAARHGPLLSPSAEFVDLTSDKLHVARFWAACGIPTPEVWAPDLFEKWIGEEIYPAVVKPRYGAGSEGVMVVPDHQTMRRLKPRIQSAADIVQSFCPGLPASVTLLAESDCVRPLPAVRQHLSTDGRLRYLGGSLPLPAGLAGRASRLAVRAVEGLQLVGMVGVDLVLGPSTDGSDDCLIEINPRLTTSYVGLRAAATADSNLAAAMVNAAEGRRSHLCFSDQQLRFDPAGEVSPHQPSLRAIVGETLT